MLLQALFMINADINSNCACGAVEIEISGKPRTSMLCACKDCQKATGTGHAAFALFQDEHVQLAGETKSFAVTARSGAAVHRHFCPNCGTPLFAVTERAPGHKLIPASYLEHLDYTPKILIFGRSLPDWDMIGNDIPTYETYKEG